MNVSDTNALAPKTQHGYNESKDDISVTNALVQRDDDTSVQLLLPL